MVMIQARLVDAEKRREGEERALIKEWLKRLKSVLYDLDNLFEEVSLAEKEEKQMDDGGKVIELVRKLILRFPRLRSKKKVAQQFEAIMEKLEHIRSDFDSLNLMKCTTVEQYCTVSLTSKRETHSLEEDENAIVEMLLKTKHEGEGNVSVIPIIGMGELGKTALAQVCYNDRDVQLHFELKAWACISETSRLKEIATTILESVSCDASDQLSMEGIQSGLRGAINDSDTCLFWMMYGIAVVRHGFILGLCRLVVNRKVIALNVGTVYAYELRGLEEDKSWALFKRLAFKEGQEESNLNLTSIGREVVKKCANVPLAIRTIAGVLYCNDTEEEWVYFKDGKLRMMEIHENAPNVIDHVNVEA